jgi:hypothetical protein
MVTLDLDPDEATIVTVRKDRHKVLFLNETDSEITVIFEPVRKESKDEQ